MRIYVDGAFWNGMDFEQGFDFLGGFNTIHFYIGLYFVRSEAGLGYKWTAVECPGECHGPWGSMGQSSWALTP